MLGFGIVVIEPVHTHTHSAPQYIQLYSCNVLFSFVVVLSLSRSLGLSLSLLRDFWLKLRFIAWAQYHHFCSCLIALGAIGYIHRYVQSHNVHFRDSLSSSSFFFRSPSLPRYLVHVNLLRYRDCPAVLYWTGCMCCVLFVGSCLLIFTLMYQNRCIDVFIYTFRLLLLFFFRCFIWLTNYSSFFFFALHFRPGSIWLFRLQCVPRRIVYNFQAIYIDNNLLSPKIV